MFKKHFIFIVFVMICLIIATADGHWWTSTFDHNPFTAWVRYTDTEITCNISEGTTFFGKKYYYEDGTLADSVWEPDLINPAEITISGEGHGHGYAQILFYGNIDNKPVGHVSTISRPIDIGWHIPGLPFANYGHEVEISQTLRRRWIPSEGEHTWNGSGSIQYTPWKYEPRAIFNAKGAGASGVWTEGSMSADGASSGGTWNVEIKTVTVRYSGSDVDVTPNCDECTDGNPNCPNASAH